MFFAAVAVFMVIGPVASVAVEAATSSGDPELIALVGKWFVFWGIGLRLATAGLRQMARPDLTSEGILGIKGREAWTLVRELGFANFAMGTIAVASLWRSEWRLAAALAGGIFLLLAGVTHALAKDRGLEENVAMISDLAIGLIMATYLAVES